MGSGHNARPEHQANADTNVLVRRSSIPARSSTGSRLQVGRADDVAERDADQVASVVLGRIRQIGTGDVSATTSGRSRIRPSTTSTTNASTSGADAGAPATAVQPAAPSRIRRSTASMASSSSVGAVSASMDSAIRRAQGGGSPLHPTVRRRMEAGFGSDLGSVRLHTDSQADSMSRALGAEAFTVGTDIFARSGRLGGDNPSQDPLLAHELAHVEQQGGTRIRRKIGFELEDSSWRVWKDYPLLPIRRAKRHEKVHQGVNYHIEGDDAGNYANLEVVTVPFDINAGGLAALDVAMNDVRNVMTHLGGFAGRDDAAGNYVVPAEHQLTGNFVKLSQGSANGTFKMQTTMGLSLEDIPTLMEYIGSNVPGETPLQTGERSESRMIQSGAANGGPGTIAHCVGGVPTLARDAVTRIRVAGAGLTPFERNAFNPPNSTAAAVGFLSQVILYAKFLSVSHNDYLKAKIPLMARTNFAALFQLLPGNQRDSLAANNAQALVDAVVHVCNGTQLLAIGGAAGGGFYDVGYAPGVSLVRRLRLMGETLRDPNAPPPIPGQGLMGNHKYLTFQSLTLQNWLEGITQGVDHLTPSTMNRWLKAHEANLGHAHRKRHVSNLESFASLGDQTDDADDPAKTRLGIFENRGIAPTLNALMPNGLMTAHQGHTAAHHYLEFLIDLKNNGVPGAFPNGPVP